MFRNEPCLVNPPCPYPIPPKHTQIQPRCFSCKHFEVCNYKRDYLKTVTLLQRALGATRPCDARELNWGYFDIPEYKGKDIPSPKLYFPETIKFITPDLEGKFYASRTNGLPEVSLIYKVKQYYVLLLFKYNKEEGKYYLEKSEEPVYHVEFELSKESLSTLLVGLINWRAVAIDAELPPPPPKMDIIDTTHFSVRLECDMYEWNKNPWEKCIRDLIHKYPYGIPIDKYGRQMYHIATYHLNYGEVPYSPYFNEERPDCPPPPYFPPHRPCPPPPPHKRG